MILKHLNIFVFLFIVTYIFYINLTSAYYYVRAYKITVCSKYECYHF